MKVEDMGGQQEWEDTGKHAVVQVHVHVTVCISLWCIWLAPEDCNNGLLKNKDMCHITQ